MTDIDVDWRRDARDEVAHAFPNGYGYVFRSVCSRTRWTAAMELAPAAPRCGDCLAALAAGVVAGPRPAVPTNPMTPETKRRVMRRRWHEAHGHY